MWNIIILNEQCPFIESVKKENQKYWPCTHEINHRKECNERWCPVAASQQAVEAEPCRCSACGREYDSDEFRSWRCSNCF